MAVTVSEIKNRKGKKQFRFRVRVRKKHPDFSKSSMKTFSDKRLGQNWANITEDKFLSEYELLASGKEIPIQDTGKDITLAEYLQLVLNDMEGLTQEDRLNKADTEVARKLINRSIGEVKKSEFTEQSVIDFLTFRIKHDGVTRATNHRDLNGLENALKWQSRIKVSFPKFITPEFKENLRDLKLTGKSKHKDYRPTATEFCSLYRHMIERDMHPNSKIRYRHLMLFAVYSSFRLAEICRIQWSEYDEKTGRVILSDRKDPNNKYGNNYNILLPEECNKIILMQKKHQKENDNRIFPFNSGSISSKFSAITELLEMPDVTFHSLRHDGISRLFEMGWNIPQVAHLSGHKNWENLKRYTHLHQCEPADLLSLCMDIEKDFFKDKFDSF